MSKRTPLLEIGSEGLMVKFFSVYVVMAGYRGLGSEDENKVKKYFRIDIGAGNRTIRRNSQERPGQKHAFK